MTVAQITARKDTSANWAAANPILSAGELGFDTTVKRLKMGDGLTSWSALGWATMATDEVAAVLAASESINAGIDTTDGAFAAVLANPASASSTELSAAIGEALIPRDTLNALDLGISGGGGGDQTGPISAACGDNPGRAIYFPPGDYRLMTPLTISTDNSLILDPDARIFAGAPMATMITYLRTATGYTEDKAIIGGLLDGNLNADRILSIAKVIRFTLEQTDFKDGVKRGLVTEAGLGAELIARNLRFYNSGHTNATDNIAIEAKMGDSHFSDIIIRDWTTAVKDTAFNRWDRIHPWISQDTVANPQMTTRYPTSIAFDITGNADLVSCVADTYRTAYKFRSDGTAFTPLARLLNCRAMWAEDPILPTAIANANPARVFDNADGVGVLSDRFTAKGPSTSPANFLIGPATGMTTRNTYSYGYIKGYTGAVSGLLDYIDGIVQGSFTFTPTFIGTTGVGSHTYTQQTGRMVVDGDVATYFIRIAGTLDATTAFSGAWRIGGMPLPQGSTNVRRAAASIGESVGVALYSALMLDSTQPQVVLQKNGGSGSAGLDVVTDSLRGKTVDLTLAVRVTHFKA